MSWIPHVLPATFVGVACAIVLPQTAFALTPEQVDEIARQVTVYIDAESSGSGTIVAREGRTYYVLTAKHVVQFQDNYQIITPDNQRHSADYRQIWQLPNVDLALLSFKSDRAYQVATLADYPLAPGAYLFLSGWPSPSEQTDERIRHFVPGQAVAPNRAFPLMRYPLSEGYRLFYTNIAEAGMSGGPVLDLAGRVVGIHGRTDGEKRFDPVADYSRRLRLGFSSGVPIGRFIEVLPARRVYPWVESAAPSDLQVGLDTYRTRSNINDLQVTLSGLPNGLSWLNYGNLLFRLERFPGALAAFEKATELEPQLYQAWYSRGLVLAAMGRNRDAVAAYDRALAIQPRFHLAWRNRALAFSNLGRDRQALDNFGEALELEPNSYITWYLQGNFLKDRLQDYENALAAYNRAISLEPNFPEAIQNRTQVMMLLEQREFIPPVSQN